MQLAPGWRRSNGRSPVWAEEARAPPVRGTAVYEGSDIAPWLDAEARELMREACSACGSANPVATHSLHSMGQRTSPVSRQR
jgi:hypothetical protein